MPGIPAEHLGAFYERHSATSSGPPKGQRQYFRRRPGRRFLRLRKLVELNLKVVKATLDEVAQKSQQAAEVKDPQEAAAFATGLLQPGAEKALAYSKHVYDIVAGVQGKLVKLTEEQIAEGGSS